MATYPIVPWIHPISPVEPYLQGTSIGARIGSENAQLAMQQMQMQAQAQRAAEAAARDDRDYAFRKAQAEAEMALRQRTADQAFQEQARRAQAQMDIQSEISALGDKATDSDIAKIYAKHWFDMGESLSGIPQMMKLSNPKNVQARIENLNGYDVLVNPATGHAEFAPPKDLNIKSTPEGFQWINTKTGPKIISKPTAKLTLPQKSNVIRTISALRVLANQMDDQSGEKKTLTDQIKDLENELNQEGGEDASNDTGLSMDDFQNWLKQSK